MPEEAEDALSTEPDSQPAGKDVKDASLTDDLAAKDRRIDELTETLKRTQAEFENYKKRMERDWSDRTKLAAERVVTDLLAILDTFDKAEEAATKEKGPGPNVDGIRGIHRQLLQALQRTGLKEIDTKGPFDPFLHEALMREEDEENDEGTILEVFQKGYMMGPKVIRTAKVKVSTRSEKEQEAAEEDVSNHNHNQHETDEE
jgi:molecular chaperone GrpE